VIDDILLPLDFATVAYFCLFSGIIADNFADEVILEPTEIAKHYLKTFFFLDLISSLPLDYILLSVSPETSVNQLVHAGLISCFLQSFCLSAARLTAVGHGMGYIGLS